LYSIALVGVFLALAVVTALLAWQNLQLKAELATDDPMRNALRPGSVIDVPALIGPEVQPALDIGVSDPREQTLILAFTRSCPSCQELLPYWNGLVGQIEPTLVRVLGVEFGISGYVAPDDGVEPQFDSRRIELAEARELNRQVPVVPATILVDDQGVVQRVWFGLLDDQDQRDLRLALGIG
jgi:hypothetical protein